MKKKKSVIIPPPYVPPPPVKTYVGTSTRRLTDERSDVKVGDRIRMNECGIVRTIKHIGVNSIEVTLDLIENTYTRL